MAAEAQHRLWMGGTGHTAGSPSSPICAAPGITLPRRLSSRGSRRGSEIDLDEAGDVAPADEEPPAESDAWETGGSVTGEVLVGHSVGQAFADAELHRRLADADER